MTVVPASRVSRRTTLRGVRKAMSDQRNAGHYQQPAAGSCSFYRLTDLRELLSNNALSEPDVNVHV